MDNFKKKKVLLINTEFPPIGGPGVQRILKFTKYLTEYGWLPTVISSRETWHNIRDLSLLNEVPKVVDIVYVKWLSIEQLVDGFFNNLFLILPSGFKKKLHAVTLGLSWRIKYVLLNIFLENEIIWILKAVIVAMKLMLDEKICIVVTSGPSHSTHLIGLLLKFFKKIKWVADFRDPWSDHVLYSKYNDFYHKSIKYKEWMVLRFADNVVTVSDGWQKLLSLKLADSQFSKFLTIHNGFDWEDVKKVSYNYRDNPSVLHFHHNGVLYKRRGCDYLLNAIFYLKNNKPDLLKKINFTFTGIPNEHKASIERYGLMGIIADIGRLEHKKSLDYCVRSDVLLLLSDKQDVTSLGAMTGKVYEYIALGKPILAVVPLEGDLAKFLSRYSHAKIVDYEDSNGIVCAIEEFIKMKSCGSLVLSDPPEWIKDYSRQKQTEKLAKILDSLIGLKSEYSKEKEELCAKSA